MTNEEMLYEINALPLEAQRHLADFILTLREHYQSSPAANPVATSPSTTEEFVGMWRDRDDMQDSTAWIRTIRQSHWSS